MKGKRYLGKRILAVALSAVMVLGCVDMPALAAEDGFDPAVVAAQDEAVDEAAVETTDAAAIETSGTAVVADEAAQDEVIADAVTIEMPSEETVAEAGAVAEAKDAAAAIETPETAVVADVAVQDEAPAEAVAEATDDAAATDAAADDISFAEDLIETYNDSATTTDPSLFDFQDVEGGVAITGFNEDDNTPTVVIPDKLNGKAVVEISPDAFKNKTKIIHLELPGTLKTIGTYAFFGCTSLEGEVTIPATVDSIGYGAFQNCNRLQKVVFKDAEGDAPQVISFADHYGWSGVFQDCWKLETLTLSNRVGNVPKSFAKSCTSLKEVVFSKTVSSIGDEAFEGCTALEKADISQTKVTSIGASAFRNCTSLQVPVFPDTLQTIGDKAYCGARLATKTEYGELVIPASVTSIGESAFAADGNNVNKLKTVTFKDAEGDSAEAITFSDDYGGVGAGTFEGSTSLEKITLSNRVGNVPKSFAKGCTSLKEVVLTGAVSYIGDGAFEGCTALAKADISQTKVTSIGASAFSNCKSLPAPVFPSTLLSIGERAYIDALKGSGDGNGSITIPAATKTIGYSAFAGCTKLESVTFENAEGDKKSAVSFGTWGTASTFQSCPALKKITFSNQTEVIPTNFAEGCTALEEIVWTDRVETISDYAFKGCTKLAKLDLSGTAVKTIGGSAFAGCTSLEIPVFPASLTEIGGSAFSGSALGTDEQFGSLKIPNTINTVGGSAFSGCTKLGRVEIEAGKQSIDPMVLGSSCFANCMELTELVFTDSVEAIPYGAARNCPRLRSITIPDSIKTIESGAFYIGGSIMLKTMLETKNKVALEYNWADDHRLLANGKIYSITYKLDGGVNSKDNPEEFEEDTETFELKEATKTGVIFGGWYLDPEFTKPIKAIEKGTMENLTLYAFWTTEELDAPYVITYFLNGGSNVAANPKKYSGKHEITFQAPTRKGYNFAGWYTDAKFTRSIQKIYQGSEGGDISLYAKWTPYKYKIIFDGNGAEGTMQAMPSCEYGTRHQLADNSFTREGYAFAGWNTKADGSGKRYGNMALVESLTDQEGGIVTLYAQWKQGAYAITYYLMRDKKVGGDNNPANPDYYMPGDTVTLEKPTMTGYIFKGWYKDYKFKKKFTGIKSSTTGNVAVYAKWAAGKYNIKFNKNGGTGSMSAMKNRVYDKTYTLTKNKFKKKGYTFVGWNTEPDGSGTPFENKAVVSNLSDSNQTVTLYAQWKKAEYTITYKCNGGYFANGKTNGGNPTTYAFDSAAIDVTGLTAPVRAGYTFQGWYSDSKCKKKVTSIKTGSTGNKTLYAKWKKGGGVSGSGLQRVSPEGSR